MNFEEHITKVNLSQSIREIFFFLSLYIISPVTVGVFVVLKYNKVKKKDDGEHFLPNSYALNILTIYIILSDENQFQLDESLDHIKFRNLFINLQSA